MSCARPRPPRPRGRWVRCIRRLVIAPPPPRASAVVDPRIGDLGPALLALEDGTVFPGVAFGAPVAAGGDLVVNTSQTGYQEVCTDPSYAGQIVVMTYPLIGNYGRLADDDQSIRPWLRASSWPTPRPRSWTTPASSRPSCATRGSRPSPASTPARSRATCARTAACAAIVTAPGEVDRGRAQAAAGPSRAGRTRTSSARSRRRPSPSIESAGDAGPLIGIVDLGLKTNIVRAMRRRGARVRVFPHTASATDVLSSDIDGVILSPGPGDPARLEAQVALARAVIDDGRPLLGICLGHQIVGRAAGADTRACASATTARTIRSTTSSSAWSR